MTLYESLDFSAREIRLVNLPPEKESESIYCRLTCLFEWETKIWSIVVFLGPSVELRPMLLNDRSHLATDNFHRVLRRLQLKSRIRSLWVDLLYINQNDDAEKTQHVQLMNSIYNDCAWALLWLGEIQGSCITDDTEKNGFIRPHNHGYGRIRRLRDFTCLDVAVIISVPPEPCDNNYDFKALSLIHKLPESAHLTSISSLLLGGADYVETDSISKTIQALRLLMVQKWWTRIGLCESAYYPLKPSFCIDLRLYLGQRLLMQRQITIAMHIFADIVKMELGSPIQPKSAHMLSVPNNRIGLSQSDYP